MNRNDTKRERERWIEMILREKERNIECLKESSVTRKKSPRVYKSFPNMISLEKLKILTPLQKLPKIE